MDYNISRDKAHHVIDSDDTDWSRPCHGKEDRVRE